jgi:hypothetical protein
MTMLRKSYLKIQLLKYSYELEEMHSATTKNETENYNWYVGIYRLGVTI